MEDAELEVQEETQEDVIGDGIDDIYVPEEEELEMVDEIDPGKEEVENPTKDKVQDKEEPTETEKALAAEIEKLKTDKISLNKALHELRQERKKAKEEAKEKEVEFTDKQLRDMLIEHQDDPQVLLNIIKQKVEQTARNIKKGVLNATEIRAKQKEVDAFITSRYPEMADEDSKLKQHINLRKGSLGLDSHPFGDYFALGVQVLDDLPEITRYWYEEGKKAAQDEKLEKARNQQIKDGELTPKGKKISNQEFEGLSPSQLETAKRLGFKTPQQLKLYKNQILASNRKPKKEEED